MDFALVVPLLDLVCVGWWFEVVGSTDSADEGYEVEISGKGIEASIEVVGSGWD